MSNENKIMINWDVKAHVGYTSDLNLYQLLRKEYKIIPEGIGTPKTSRRQNKILIKPFIIDKYDVLYLHEKYLVL